MLTQPIENRRAMIEFGCESISVARQCELLCISRSGLYYRPKPQCEESMAINKLVDSIYTAYPYYGSRRIAIVAGEQLQRPINRKRIQRSMREMGIAGIAPGPNTSKANPGHKIYPYLLRDVSLSMPDHVWSTDITYVRLSKGFAYLVAVIDWYSRYVLSWRLSNSLDASFCIEALEDALAKGKPQIFNTDQGSQFTSNEYTAMLKGQGILISMDGRGRALDNIFVERLWRTVKYEDIYLKGYTTMGEAESGLSEYFDHYNHDRTHQSLGYILPCEVHFGSKHLNQGAYLN